MYLQGAKMSKYSIYACFGVSLLLFSKLKIKLLHKIWRSSSTADPRHYKSRATDIHTPLHSLLKKIKIKIISPLFLVSFFVPLLLLSRHNGCLHAEDTGKFLSASQKTRRMEEKSISEAKIF